MKRALLVVLVAVGARAATTMPQLTPDQVLSSLDTTPTTDQINAAFMNQGSDAMTGLVSYATSASNVAVRLRAIHALSQYCVAPCADLDPAHVALHDIADAQPVPQSGSDLLVLRAAIESLGLMKDPNDVATIAAFLNHNSRDIRATAALALGDLCNTTAVTPLRARTQYETVDQVKLAISSALRVLSACQ